MKINKKKRKKLREEKEDKTEKKNKNYIMLFTVAIAAQGFELFTSNTLIK